MARATHPKFMDWKDHYANFEGFMAQGSEVDRWLLSGMDRQAFAETAADLAARLTDAVIDDAVRRLPPEWYAIDGAGPHGRAPEAPLDPDGRGGASTTSACRARWTSTAPTASMSLACSHLPDGRLQLELQSEKAGEPWFRRTFVPDETREVRLYLYGGADRVATEGSAGRADHPARGRRRGRRRPRRLGAAAAPASTIPSLAPPSRRGPARTRTTRPGSAGPPSRQETPWLEWRDWGARTLPQFQVWWEPDPGLMLAAGLRRQSWGFRKFPYASLQSVQLQFSTGRQDFKFNYDGEFRRENSKLYFVVDAQASGLENLNYFGAGNDTSSEPPGRRDESFFDAASDTYMFTVGPRWALTRTFEAYLSAEAKWTRTPQDQDTFIGYDQPYGTGDFGQAGVKAGFDLDTRGHRLAGTMGDQFRADGKPALSGLRLQGRRLLLSRKRWDAQSAFGGVDGRLRGYLVGRKAMLAARGRRPPRLR